MAVDSSREELEARMRAAALKRKNPDAVTSDPLRDAERVLEKVFGYHSFRSHQAAIVTALIGGHDVLALMPTGGGKSICYQVPSLVRAGTGIIISPLIAVQVSKVQATALANLATPSTV